VKSPCKIIFHRSFDFKLEANGFELKLKSLKNIEYIKREYNEFFIGM